MVIAGAIFGLAGSVAVREKGRAVLAMSGILTILAVVIFVAGLATDPELTDASLVIGSIGVFDSRTFEFTLGSMTLSYSLSSYLHIGFFLAVVASILAFISLLKYPTASS